MITPPKLTLSTMHFAALDFVMHRTGEGHSEDAGDERSETVAAYAETLAEKHGIQINLSYRSRDSVCLMGRDAEAVRACAEELSVYIQGVGGYFVVE